jgi:hypothetical protein
MGGSKTLAKYIFDSEEQIQLPARDPRYELPCTPSSEALRRNLRNKEKGNAASWVKWVREHLCNKY